MIANAGIAKWGSIVDGELTLFRFSRERKTHAMDGGDLEATVEDWDRMFSINVRGTFLCFKYAGKQMISQGRGGRMIAAASIASKRGTRILWARTIC